MSDHVQNTPNTSGQMSDGKPVLDSPHNSKIALARLAKRHRKERWFRRMGLGAIGVAMLALIWLLMSLVGTGYTAFYQHSISLDVELTEEVLDPEGARDPDKLRGANYRRIIQQSMYKKFPEVTERRSRAQLFGLVSSSGATDHVRQMVYNDPNLVGQNISIRVPTSDNIDQLLKGYIDRNVSEDLRKVTDQQIMWADSLKAQGDIRVGFNTIFFTNADSRDPELAGIAGAVAGSIMLLLVAFALALPIGVGAAIYLDEFAPKSKFTDFIEININNLAAVPSIIFGLLGLAIFLNVMHLPRSAPLVGGLVLALRAFPTIVIATRAALQSVSPSMVDGALSLGASRVQAVFHQKVPLAGPGILTGSIIAMAQVLGETAPLLMIGMVAFITEVPQSFTDPASALPVQIFLWSDSAERAWSERTSAAIIVLLFVLICMNGFAIWLRGKLEKRR